MFFLAGAPWTGLAFLGVLFFGFLAAFGLAMNGSRVFDAGGIVADAEAKEKAGNAPRLALLRRLFAPPPSAQEAEAGEAGAE